MPACENEVVHPAIAFAEHLDEEFFELKPVVIAPEEEFFDGGSQLRVISGDLLEGSPSRATVGLRRLFINAEVASEASEERLLDSNFTTERVDGRDAQLCRQIDQLPTEGAGTFEGAPRERLHRKIFQDGRIRSGRCFFQLSENAMAHLRGGRLSKGDGNDLGGVVYFSEQRQKAAREQIGFARAGGRLDK